MFAQSTFQLWPQVFKIKLLHCLKFILSLSKKNNNKKQTSWLFSGRHVTHKCQQSSPLLHQWRVSSSPWWHGVKGTALVLCSFMALELIFRLHRRKPSVLLVLFTTLLMWLSQSVSCCMRVKGVAVLLILAAEWTPTPGDWQGHTFGRVE